MQRTVAITGSASGIGQATREVLESSGARTIGIDIRDADVQVDLATSAGREALPGLVGGLAPDGLDAIVAVAGVAVGTALTVRVNYFGAVASLEGLRPLLAHSTTPRAAAVASFSTLQDVDDELVAHCLAGDEDTAVATAERLVDEGRASLIYASSKRAISRWIRRASILPDWAGKSIPINAVAPGVIRTPMTAPVLDVDEGRAAVLEAVPMPLNGVADPTVVAHLLAWLVGETNTHVTGQVVFVDGGADATVRRDDIFASVGSSARLAQFVEGRAGARADR